MERQKRAGRTTTAIGAAVLAAAWMVGVVAPPAAAAGRPEVTGPAAAPGVQCRAEGFSPVDRESVLERARRWVDDEVPYDQGKCHESGDGGSEYRTDCSGFVSMAWALGRSYTTGNFARDRQGAWHSIDWDELEPGDAIVAHTKELQHMVLFVKWKDDDRTRLKTYESRGEDLGTVSNVRQVDAMKEAGYHPIRLDDIEG